MNPEEIARERRLALLAEQVTLPTDDLRWLLKELHDARENASSGWECLEMVREVFAYLVGEDEAKGIAPMFFPEAIRSFLFRAASGDFDDKIPVDKLPEVLAKRAARLSASPTPAGGTSA